MWVCDNVEDVAAVADNQGVKPLTPAEHIAELERMGYTVQIKEKGLETTAPTKVTADSSTQLNNFNQFDTTTNSGESQDLERYTLDQIKQLFDYDIMIADHSERKTDIDIVFTILYDALNWAKPTIRVDGQDKPSMVVISKLMKLEQSDLWYTIEKYHEQQERIKNVNAYLLTILYHAKEQSYLDLMNLGHHNGDF